MALTIKTAYAPPTEKKGARILAQVVAHPTILTASITVPYEHGLSPVDNHVAAAKALIAKHRLTKAPSYVLQDNGPGFLFVPSDLQTVEL